MLASDGPWFRDAGALVRRPLEFWPSRDQTPEERLNSLVRFLAYVSVAVYAYSRRPKWLLFGLGAATVVSLAYSVDDHPATTDRRKHRPWLARMAAPDDAQRSSTTRRGSGGRGGAGSGGGASGGGRALGPARCTLSSPENPFANVLVGGDPSRPPACKYDEHKHLIRRNFNAGLVRDAFDIYERQNNQRQWMTMPVTTSAPDTVAFANFCYGSGRPTCKEDTTRCTGFYP